MFKTSTVFILHFNPACVLLSVCGLHFTLSLHFTPGPQSAVCVLHWPKMLLLQELRCVTTVIPWLSFRRFHLFKRTLCHVQSRNRLSRESPAGSVQCSKMTKIDPVSTFYPTFWLKKGILQWENLRQVQKSEPLGCPYLLLRVSKLEVFIQLPLAYHENSWTSMVTSRDYIQ